MAENVEGSDHAGQKTRRDVLQDEFFKIISLQNRKTKRFSALILEQTGLTFPQMIVLMDLDENEGSSTMQTLAQHLHQTGGAMTNLVDRLFNAGLVTREAVPQDRRIVQVVLTDEGRARIKELNTLFTNEHKRISEALSDDELEQFIHVLHKLSLGMDSAIQRLLEEHHKAHSI